MHPFVIIAKYMWKSKVSNDRGFVAEANLTTKKLRLKGHGKAQWEVTVDFIQPGFWGKETPEGYYLVDTMQVHPRIKIDWCNLHREMPDSSGFYGYIQDPTDPNPKWERQGLGLHPGSGSKGCITVPVEQWSAVKAVINAGQLTYKGNQTFAGLLHVVK